MSHRAPVHQRRARTHLEVMVRVSRVQPNSIAAELGIEPGTELRSVNGRDLADFLDWEFLTADDEGNIVTSSPEIVRHY